jgi:hypothetical protein
VFFVNLFENSHRLESHRHLLGGAHLELVFIIMQNDEALFLYITHSIQTLRLCEKTWWDWNE